jgi:hypothetical protein
MYSGELRTLRYHPHIDVMYLDQDPHACGLGAEQRVLLQHLPADEHIGGGARGPVMLRIRGCSETNALSLVGDARCMALVRALIRRRLVTDDMIVPPWVRREGCKVGWPLER